MSGGLCSLECSAKIVAWFQVIGHGIMTFALLLLLVLDVAAGFSPEIRPNSTNRSDLVRLLEEEEAAYHLGLVILGLILLFTGTLFVLSFLLLVGVYKTQMKYVKYWLIGKGILLFLAGFILLLSIIGLLFGIDSDLTKKILWFVVDCLQVWVIYVFWSEKKDDYIPA